MLKKSDFKMISLVNISYNVKCTTEKSVNCRGSHLNFEAMRFIKYKSPFV